MRAWTLLAVLLLTGAARAQTADAGDPWSAFTQQESALETTTTSDCDTACKALESLARAADHICRVAPEHCDEAKARLRAASDRVHAACPQCAARAELAPGETRNDGVPVTTVQASERAPSGCGGCTTASTRGSGGLALFALALLLLGTRIRRR